jgi:hypothetical protein
MSARQLRLPMRDRLPDVNSKRARRDWSAKEFARALARNGFRQEQSGLAFLDERGGFAGMVLAEMGHTPELHVRRRATLAKLLRAREAASS